MVEQSGTSSLVFAAIADPTRRAILSLLAEGERTISQLAEPFDMSFYAVSKHVRVLERAGLIDREIVGREHRCRLDPEPLREISDWVEQYRFFWEERLEALEHHVLRKRRAHKKK